MEIFTSITFWVIVIAIIVIFGIIGYLAEGTILAGKNKKEVKNEKKKEKENLDAWTKDAPTEAELRQEKVYQTADKSWNEIPDAPAAQAPVAEDNTGNETIDFAMPDFSKPAASPATDTVFNEQSSNTETVDSATAKPVTDPIFTASEGQTPVVNNTLVNTETSESEAVSQPVEALSPVTEVATEPSVANDKNMTQEVLKPASSPNDAPSQEIFNQQVTSPNSAATPAVNSTSVQSPEKQGVSSEESDIWKS